MAAWEHVRSEVSVLVQLSGKNVSRRELCVFACFAASMRPSIKWAKR